MSRKKKNACPTVGAAGQAVENGIASQTPHASADYDIISPAIRQPFRIADLLHPGAGNAISRRDLMALTGLSDRELRLMIETERRRGIPILSDNIHGYFLPGDSAERDRCVRSLRRRGDRGHGAGNRACGGIGVADVKGKHPSWFKMKLERRELVRQLSPETAVNVLLACWDYLETGEKPFGLSPIESVAFSSFMPDMDEAWSRYIQRITAKSNRTTSTDIDRPHTTSTETEEETEEDSISPKGDIRSCTNRLKALE